MARKFLYVIAVAIVLVLAVLFALRFWAKELTEFAFTPSVPFAAPAPLAENVYDDPAMWIARPGIGTADPARWLPAGVKPDADALNAAVFFIHPTSYLEKAHWNAPLDEPTSRERANAFVRISASPFNASANLWAPRYRQAAFGAFVSAEPAAAQAVDAAYADVARAFDYFLASAGKDTPIVLAGHSQGAMHLLHLLKDKVAGKPLARRIAAAYVIGWPVSLTHDLPLTGLQPCARPEQTGCVMSWQTFAEPADTRMALEGYARWPGLDGQPRAGSAFLCTNPLTGGAPGEARAAANLGALVPANTAQETAGTDATLAPALVAARCGPDGFLYIGAPPEVGSFVLPGNNYHVYDVALFWANLRTDAANRVKAWKPQP